MSRINILKNGEQFARTIPPFYEEDASVVEAIIKWLQEGRWCVGNGVLQIVNPTMQDDQAMDMLNFDGLVDQVSNILAHPSVIQMRPSQDKWSFVENPCHNPNSTLRLPHGRNSNHKEDKSRINHL